MAIRLGALRLSIFTFVMCFCAQESSATAIAAVNYNGFSFYPWFWVADGENRETQSFHSGELNLPIAIASNSVTLSEIETGHGDVSFRAPAFGVHDQFFFASIGGSASANPDGYAFGSLTFQVTLSFTNLTGMDFDFVAFQTSFSSFNPGGPGIGARVNNSASEFARFETRQTGSGIGDEHRCDTRLTASQTNFSGPPASSCGVDSPDSSQLDFTLSDFDANETQFRTFSFSLVLEASSIPEPSTLMIFMGMLACFAYLRSASQHRSTLWRTFKTLG